MRTLLVEDHPGQREVLHRHLAKLGLEVTSVGDAGTGLEEHLRAPFELLVIDWVMAGMDGLQLCAHVRSRSGGDRPYIIVVTGRDQASDLAEVLDAGADDYMAKPVDASLLQTRVRIAQRRLALDARHREAREALARSEASLAQADRLASVGSLAAGVAHEINNPLAYVIANLELMAEDLSKLENRPSRQTRLDFEQTLREAAEGAHRVRRIVGDLESFARAGEEDEESHPVDVEDVLETALDIAANEIRHRARLVREYADVPATWGNDGRLTQVFLSLLVNAAHAIPDGDGDHRICARTRTTDDGWILVEIVDTGVGMDSDVVERIFDPFFTTKPLGMGTGLGLSICHGIVTEMGGRIEVNSAPGAGTTFTVTLPPAQQEARRTRPRTWPDIAVDAARTLEILVVDDEPLICQGIRRALSAHHVEVASSGGDAIRKCEDGDFDLVLCDVMMPDVSGMDVYGRVRCVRPGLAERFVFMTGGAFTPNAKKFLESVSNDRIIKPFSLRELRALVAKHAIHG